MLLDTNVLSELMKARPASQVLGWLDRQPHGDLYTGAITRAEIELGIALPPRGRQRDGLARAARRCSRTTSPAPYWRSTTKLQCTMPGGIRVRLAGGIRVRSGSGSGLDPGQACAIDPDPGQIRVRLALLYF